MTPDGPTLVLFVRFHEGRYHGTGPWPPAPARLFQALVAGAGLSGPLPPEACRALEWLEARPGPWIGAPVAISGQRLRWFVPQNDADAVQADLNRLGKIRSGKWVQPRLFARDIPLFYAWSVSAGVEDVAAARAVAGLADHLYQLGRGIDLAWAWADILEAAAWEHLLSTYPGRVHRPTPGGREGLALACPQPGSLESLRARHRAMGERFGTRQRGRVRSTVWTQPPPARFARVVYDGAPFRRVYELRGAAAADAPFVPHDPERVTALVVAIRDGAVARLTTALPELRDTVRRSLVGRRPDGSDAAPPGARVRLVPLPSAGHAQADGRIRRVLVEVPAACPLDAGDVDWACSGLVLAEPALGLDVALQPAADGSSWEARYAVAASVWQTLTPAALPFVPPGSGGDDPRAGPRVDGGIPRRGRAAAAVLQALRHVGVRSRVASLRVQREPFFSGGLRAEAYASPRFDGGRLWHVEVTFAEPVAGPVVLGDGRFLGLGVMLPAPQPQGVFVFAVEEGLQGRPDPEVVATALRRAVMSRVQAVRGGQGLPEYFSGHEVDGGPARGQSTGHIACVFDPEGMRLLVFAPHVLDGRSPRGEEHARLGELAQALEGFRELRAGPAGRLRLRPVPFAADADPLAAPARLWESVTPYCVTRHVPAGDAARALADDVRSECTRRRLPLPVDIRPLAWWGEGGVGLQGRLRLAFAHAVSGPLLLGRTRYRGGGLFRNLGSWGDGLVAHAGAAQGTGACPGDHRRIGGDPGVRTDDS